VASGLTTNSLEAFPYSLPQIVFSPDGGLLALASRSGVIAILDSFTGDHRFTLSNFTNTPGIDIEVAFSPDSKFIACGSDNGLVHIFDSGSGKEGTASLKTALVRDHIILVSLYAHGRSCPTCNVCPVESRFRHDSIRSRESRPMDSNILVKLSSSRSLFCVTAIKCQLWFM
jgi:WD40 repeat protein